MTDTNEQVAIGQGASERRLYLEGRVGNAKRIGRPAHIARCEARLAGFDARMSARTQEQR